MNPLKDRVPVEELAPARIERIEHGVMRAYRNLPPPRRSTVGRLARTAVPALALAGVAIAFYAGRSTAPVTAPVERTLAVSTGADATDFKIGDISLRFSPGTRAQITEAAGITVALEQGGIDCDVAPRRERPPFVVVADDVEVTVIGTKFAVERGDDVSVSVDHGRVKVSSPAGELFLTNGERWARSSNVLAANTEKEANPSQSPLGDTEGTAHDPANDPANDPATAPDTAPIPPKTPTVALSDRHGSHPGVKPAGAPASATTGKPTTTVPTPVPAPAKPAALARQIQDISLAPILSLPANEKAAAIPNYATKVANADSATAAHALYSMAYVHHFELRQNAEALRALSAYEKRFPHGKQAESVLWLRIRILCERSLDDSCRSAAHSFLRKFPGAEGKAAIATRIVNEM